MNRRIPSETQCVAVFDELINDDTVEALGSLLMSSNDYSSAESRDQRIDPGNMIRMNVC